MSEIEGRSVLVTGTEEFMYPALVLGRRLERSAGSVRTHSTTRSPLLPKSDSDYPLHSRAEFTSMYEPGRTTYLYNLGRYDTVILVTDANGDSEGLLGALRRTRCEKIYLLRVRNAD
jgi:hypothetical protein